MTTSSPQPLQHTIEVDNASATKARRTVVLLHGFPDNSEVWRPTAEHLKSTGYRVVLVTLPGFEEHPPVTLPLAFSEVVERLHHTLKVSHSLGATLIGHDWGAIFIYLLLNRYPEDAARVVTLEVGVGPRTPWLTLFVLAYHALFNAIFALRAHVGGRLMGTLMKLVPRPKYPGSPPLKARHAWLYRQAWREGARGGLWPFYFRNAIAQWQPHSRQPFLFLYGDRTLTGLRFHSGRWLAEITSIHPLSRTQALGGGHWCFLEDQDAFHTSLSDFFNATDGPRPATGEANALPSHLP